MKVGVHNGTFHADDVFSVAALRRIHDRIEVVRTRDLKILAECDIRVDVGGEYSHQKLTYDHHQSGGAGERENGVPYAGFGLIWKHYGLDCCGGDPLVVKKVEEVLVQPIDAADNGFKLHTGWKIDGVMGYSISSAISSLNPAWQEGNKDFDLQFGNAVAFAGLILEREIIRAQGKVQAYGIVKDAIAKMDGQIVQLDKYCPWQETVIQECPEALFVVYPSETEDWMVQSIPPELGSFEQRKPLPESWAGLRDDAFKDATHVNTAIFCHPGRFICGATTREGAIHLARLAVAAE